MTPKQIRLVNESWRKTVKTHSCHKSENFLKACLEWIRRYKCLCVREIYYGGDRDQPMNQQLDAAKSERKGELQKNSFHMGGEKIR